MARSEEQTENWLSSRDNSTLGLLSSCSGPQLSELLLGQGELPVRAPVGAGASGISSALLLLLLVGAVLAGTLGGTMLAGTLEATTAARAELMGNLDGAGLVSA